MTDGTERKDPLSAQERSERMARVRNRGNVSTEGQVEAALLAAGIGGWEKHPKDIPGRPDFFFRAHSLAVFVDGCFWHACPRCARRTPHSRSEFWKTKIEANRRRDNRTRRRLNREGYHYLRVWEHEVKKGRWLARIQRTLYRLAIETSDYELVSDAA